MPVQNPCTRSRPDAGRDAGFTLIEVLVAIVLSGGVIAVLMGSLLTVLSATQTSSEQAKVEAVLIGASDNLAATPWSPCPTGVDYLSAAQSAASNVDWSGSQVTILGAQEWKRTGDDPLADGGWGPIDGVDAPCQQEDAKDSPSTTLQLVTIQVTSPSGDVQRQIDVVKSVVTDLTGLGQGGPA